MLLKESISITALPYTRKIIESRSTGEGPVKIFEVCRKIAKLSVGLPGASADDTKATDVLHSGCFISPDSASGLKIVHYDHQGDTKTARYPKIKARRFQTGRISSGGDRLLLVTRKGVIMYFLEDRKLRCAFEYFDGLVTSSAMTGDCSTVVLCFEHIRFTRANNKEYNRIVVLDLKKNWGRAVISQQIDILGPVNRTLNKVKLACCDITDDGEVMIVCGNCPQSAFLFVFHKHQLSEAYNYREVGSFSSPEIEFIDCSISSNGCTANATGRRISGESGKVKNVRMRIDFVDEIKTIGKS